VRDLLLLSAHKPEAVNKPPPENSPNQPAAEHCLQAAANDATEPLPPEGGVPAREAGRIRILLVEDSPSDALLLEESLSQDGLGPFQFTRCETLAGALEHLRANAPDVVLLDLNLPDSSGKETFLRARTAAPSAPIVVLTGAADEALGVEAVRNGVQDYLIKGQAYGRQTARAIRYAIERKQAEEALKQADSALREKERQLREANQALEARVVERTAALQETISELEGITHSVTHDLRGPLRAMSAFGQLLREECTACHKPQARDYVERITASTLRMDKLIQDVLQYRSLAGGEMRLVPVEVVGLLRGILNSYPAFQSPQVAIRIVEPMPKVLGNEAALTQCLSNLLGNAVKFVAPGTRPRVCVWAEARGATVRLWVSDNGIGIPGVAQERVFNLFERLHPEFEGSGVGLTVVRKAVEKMGGKVGLESEPGRGSRFWLELKAAGV
jgi:signal transduction histidine kinase